MDELVPNQIRHWLSKPNHRANTFPLTHPSTQIPHLLPSCSLRSNSVNVTLCSLIHTFLSVVTSCQVQKNILACQILYCFLDAWWQQLSNRGEKNSMLYILLCFPSIRSAQLGSAHNSITFLLFKAFNQVKLPKTAHLTHLQLKRLT